MKSIKSYYIRFLNKRCKGVCVLCKYRKACMEEREAELEKDYCRKVVAKELTDDYTEELNRLHEIIEGLTKEKDEYEAELHSIQIKLCLERIKHKEALQEVQNITKKYEESKRFSCTIGNCDLRSCR